MSEDPRQRLLRNMRRSKIPGMNAIRGMSAFTVVLFHLVTWRAPGRLAVMMFFVLSGLLITWTLLGEEERNGRVDLKAFYIRRGLRLIPALYLLLLWEAVTNLPPTPGMSIAAAAAYCSNYYIAIQGIAAGGKLLHSWSLGVEEHFYLLWPLAFRLVTRGRLLWFTLAAAISSAILRAEFSLKWSPHYASYATETNASAILTGCALALWIWRAPQSLPRFLFYPVLSWIALLSVLWVAQLPEAATVAWMPLCIPSLAVLLLQAITYEWEYLENPVLDFLGRISYSIYLWHLVAGAVVLQFLSPGGAARCAGVALAIAWAAASYYAVERPVQRWVRARLTWLDPKPDATTKPLSA